MSMLRRIVPFAVFSFALPAAAQGPSPTPPPTPRPPAATPAPRLPPTPGAATTPGTPAPAGQLPAGRAPAAPSPAPLSAAPAPIEPPQSKMLATLEERLKQIQSGRGLTSEEVARRAQANSVALEAKRHAIRASESSLSQAKAGYWPQLTLSASYQRLSAIEAPALGDGSIVVTPAPPGPLGDDPDLIATTFEFPVLLNNYRLNAALNVPLSDYLLRTSQNVAAASHARDAAVADKAGIYASVSRDARVAYYNWIRAQARELIQEQSLELARGLKQDAENGFAAGLRSRADVLSADARVKRTELALEQSRNATRLGNVQLAVMMRDSSGKRYEAGEDVFAEKPELSSLPTVETAYREATTQRAEFKVIRSNEQSLLEQAKVARAGMYPRLDAQANLTYANPHPRFFPQEDKFHGTWDVGAVLSWTPTDIAASSSAASAAEARAMEVAAQRKSLSDSLRYEVEQALLYAAEARYAIEVSRNTAAAEEESYRVRRELFRAGRATQVELTDAETQLTTARLQLADAHVAAHIALVQLHHALGRDQKPIAPAR
jgi:outer membrane protein